MAAAWTIRLTPATAGARVSGRVRSASIPSAPARPRALGRLRTMARTGPAAVSSSRRTTRAPMNPLAPVTRIIALKSDQHGARLPPKERGGDELVHWRAFRFVRALGSRQSTGHRNLVAARWKVDRQWR